MKRFVPIMFAVVSLAGVLALVAAASRSTSTAQSAWAVTPVASGLDSPRGLAVEPNGTLLVAESGHGGDVCVGSFCMGLTSQISSVDTTTGAHAPVVKGLYSRSVAMEGITGVDGISAGGGKLYGAMTSFPQELSSWSCAGQPSDCGTTLAAARAQAGQVFTFTPGGTFKLLAGVGAHDYDWAGAGHPYSTEPQNANPYGIVALPAGAFVADAGANSLDFVSANGTITVASAIAPPPPGGFPADTVPTCVTVARGNLYAASLSGHLWKRNGSFVPTEIPVTDSGGKSLIHHVTGCTTDRAGNLFLVDMWGTPGPPIPAGPASTAGTGSVVELSATGVASVLARGLDFPNGIAATSDGSLYVTVGSTCTAQGTPFPYCAKGGGIIRLHG
jgi:hypothetical protein